jgi:DNA-binding IclR family transcriptional regulator
VIDYRKKIVAAISTSGTQKKTAGQKAELAEQVMRTAGQISKLLGAE